MRLHIALFLCFVVALADVSPATAQVDEIVKASKDHSQRSQSEGSGSMGFVAFDFAYFAVDGLIQWQRVKLQSRPDHPEIVSLEVSGLAAVQPSTYYILHPRIRGNWGIFSTDFRLNYLIEESLEGTRHIRTDDWQVLQLNLITDEAVNLWIGGGFIHENFNDGAVFSEGTAGLRVRPRPVDWWIHGEFRFSEPRKEVNASVLYPVVRRSRMTIFAVGGGAFQRYYAKVNVWGMQAGLLVRVF